MARAVLLVWTFSVTLLSANFAEAGIGVNWGIMAFPPLPADIVVGMLKANGVKKVKLFDADYSTVNALGGTGIEVMVAIPNNQLKDIAGSYDNAVDWVQMNVTEFIKDGGVNISYVCVGNEPFLTSYNGSFTKTTFPALKNIQKALNAAGHTIKATIPLNADVYESQSNKPSDGDFRKDIHGLMVDIVRFLHQNKSPFMVNIYPFLSLYQNPNFPMDLAFFDGGGTPIQDKNEQYTNIFDANYDTLVWSLKKNGFGDMKIIVGEAGWPTDGDKNANKKLAKRFYDGLMKKIAAKKGTPLRPGEMEVYLFGLLDENAKNVMPGFFERHWGIFSYDGKPKFPIDLSGQGRSNKMAIAAKGVKYMDSKWCVLSSAVTDLSGAKAQVDYACSNSDCTTLGYGCSCNNLGNRGNLSYAFNMYFQMQNQKEETCDFDGLAEIVTQNASKGGCLFPIQIVGGAGERLALAAAVVASIFAGLTLLFNLFALGV